MPGLIKRHSRKVGQPPGSLVFVGERKAETVGITLIDYDDDRYDERKVSVDQCTPLRETPTVSWINIDGLHDTDILERLGGDFGIHPLVLEDIANTDQRPKTEVHEGYLFIVMKMLSYDEKTEEVGVEQVSLILGRNFLLSFQEAPGDVFDAVRERIRTKRGRVRQMGADYLAYCLLDAVVDNYYVVLEKVGEKVEALQDRIVSDPAPESLNTLHHMRRGVIYLRKAIWPLREVLATLQRRDSDLIVEGTEIYIRDVYDHVIQTMDSVETVREMLSAMVEMYMSSVSNRMNEVMKVLTIIATIFIPLTFIAGIYGMNFEYMPELGWKPAYFVVLAVMAGVGVAMAWMFRRKRWL
ncbi:MAG: magnesium/cobalt transporter CorA [Phycisphaerae bacterium]